jgi:hypothetical protein
MYHPRRTFSRIDLIRQVLGVVTVGAVLAYGGIDLIFRDILDYPRTLFMYNLALSVAFVVVDANRIGCCNGRCANAALRVTTC